MPVPAILVLAMGKMGGRELNYSSDIDLMVFFDASADRLDPTSCPARFTSNSPAVS